MPGKFRSAVTALTALSVAGVLHNYDVDAVPESFGRGSLPVLLVEPSISDSVREKFDVFAPATPSGSSALVAYFVTQRLLYSPIGAGRGARSQVGAVVDILDTYANVVRANLTLGGVLHLPLIYSATVGPVRWAGVLYFGATMWLKMVVEV